MTREEAIKALSVLKAAYPNFYKGMTKDEANGTINVWAAQFAKYPAFIVMIALNKLISTNTFPPAICEIKERIRALYWEAWTMQQQHEQAIECGIGQQLDDKTLEAVKAIISACGCLQTRTEPTLGELLQGYSGYLTGGECVGMKQIN